MEAIAEAEEAARRAEDQVDLLRAEMDDRFDDILERIAELRHLVVAAFKAQGVRFTDDQDGRGPPGAA